MLKSLWPEIKEWQTKWKTTGWKLQQESRKNHSRDTTGSSHLALLPFCFSVLLSDFIVFTWSKSKDQHMRQGALKWRRMALAGSYSSTQIAHTSVWVAFCRNQAWQGGRGHAVQSLDGEGQDGLGGSVREQREGSSLLLLPDQCS